MHKHMHIHNGARGIEFIEILQKIHKIPNCPYFTKHLIISISTKYSANGNLRVQLIPSRCQYFYTIQNDRLTWTRSINIFIHIICAFSNAVQVQFSIPLLESIVGGICALLAFVDLHVSEFLYALTLGTLHTLILSGVWEGNEKGKTTS